MLERESENTNHKMPNAMEISRYAPARTIKLQSTIFYIPKKYVSYSNIFLPKKLGWIGNLTKFNPLQNFCLMKGLIFWEDVLSTKSSHLIISHKKASEP